MPSVRRMPPGAATDPEDVADGAVDSPAEDAAEQMPATSSRMVMGKTSSRKAAVKSTRGAKAGKMGRKGG